MCIICIKNITCFDLGSYIFVTSLVCKGHLLSCLLLDASNGANSTPPVTASYKICKLDV